MSFKSLSIKKIMHFDQEAVYVFAEGGVPDGLVVPTGSMVLLVGRSEWPPLGAKVGESQ